MVPDPKQQNTLPENLNMDFSKRLIVETAEMDWLPSPAPGVRRKPLERLQKESGHTTSIVKYAPDTSFASHSHPLGEEIFVLEGVFSDESGDYPAGSYLRNPPGSRHAPFSKDGCVIFVKLNQFASTDLTQVRLQTELKASQDNPDAPSRKAMMRTRRIATVFVAIPSMYGALLSVKSADPEDFSQIRYAVSGGEPLPEDIFRRFQERFGIAIHEGYGLTETSPVTHWCRPSEFRAHCVGLPLPEVEQRITCVERGRTLRPGEDGEIRVRGPNVMLGYYRDPEATANARAFDWHHTGDLGMWDDDGQLLFKDRKKDMIKTGGENVPSVKVEAVLLQHPDVANAAAVGLPHARWIEAVTAFVTLKPGCSPSETELLEHCKAHLGGFEVPKAIHQLETLPMTSTGKVQKQPLRERYSDLYGG